MELTEDQQKVVDFLKERESRRSKFYFKDFLPIFPDKGPRQVKKVLTELVNGQVLEFWSSGSTTMYGLFGAGKQGADEREG